MRQIPEPKRDFFDDFSKIAAAKYAPNKDILLDQVLSNQIKSAYNEYKTNIDAMNPLPLNSGQKDALKVCYTSRTEHSQQLMGAILSNGCKASGNLCPYCDLIDIGAISDVKAIYPNSDDNVNSTTIEHYFSKDSFPEYSTFGLNLIPCCPICNQQKGKANSRLFVHFYLDSIPEDISSFIKASIDFNATGDPLAKFEIVMPQIHPGSITHHAQIARIYNLLSSHFDGLELGSRYMTRASTIITRKTKSLSQSKFSFDEMRSELYKDADILIDERGKHFWEAALYIAMAESKEFIEYVENYRRNSVQDIQQPNKKVFTSFLQKLLKLSL